MQTQLTEYGVLKREKKKMTWTCDVWPIRTVRIKMKTPKCVPMCMPEYNTYIL